MRDEADVANLLSIHAVHSIGTSKECEGSEAGSNAAPPSWSLEPNRLKPVSVARFTAAESENASSQLAAQSAGLMEVNLCLESRRPTDE